MVLKLSSSMFSLLGRGSFDPVKRIVAWHVDMVFQTADMEQCFDEIWM